MSSLTPPLPQERQAMLDVYVLPGDVRVGTTPTRFTTILGSCVAVCLYDTATGIGGINHYLLPGQPPEEEDARLRWSGPSITALLERLIAAGALRPRLQAKLFGGACITGRSAHAGYRIGERNIEEAVTELARLGISVKNRDVGGNTGRKLIFESSTGHAWIKLLHPE